MKFRTQLLQRHIVHSHPADKIEPVAYRDSEEHPFLGKEMHEQRKYSEKTAALIDEEMRAVLIQAEDLARETLGENKDVMEQLVLALMENEIVDRAQLEEIMGPRQSLDEKKLPPTTDEVDS